MTITASRSLTITRLSTTFGAVIEGIDLREDLSEAAAREIWTALVEHKAIFFPRQQITSAEQVAFGARFGTLTPSHPVQRSNDPDLPEIYEVNSAGKDARNDMWHTDVTFVESPPKATMLRAVQVPEIGGDTLWADLEAAYRSLSVPVQELVDGLTAAHDAEKMFPDHIAAKIAGEVEFNKWEGKAFDFKEVHHPVVRVHPETGRKALFVNPTFTVRIDGVSDAESRGILDALYAHILKPEHIVRHKWSAGDIGFWDNRNTVHYANYDYGTFNRIMERVTLVGDVPIGPHGLRSWV